MASKRPDSDVWNIVDNDEMSQHYGRNFKFDFSYISSDEIKELFKDYVWQNYRVGNKTLSSLYREVNSYFYRFIQFAESRNIISLKGLTNVDVENYISYLHTTISEKTGKPYGISMQRHSLFALKSVIRWCQLHRPDDAPVTEIFTGSEYTGVNRKLKIDFIPDDVVAQINEALKTEENQYLKYGIIILQSTGMRIGDLLKLRIDCIKPHPISGYTIEWVQHKGRKNKAPMPVRSECVAAIEKLIEITKELRDEADEKDKDTLMIWRVSKGNRYIQQGTVQVVSKGTFANYWFKKFIKDNDIKDANGDYYNLTSHQFRRTLGTDMLSKGTNINVSKSAKKKNAINVYSLEHWNDQKLMPFIKRWDIRGNKGELYPLTSHQFRATFVRELIKRKVPIAMIMKQYSHVSIEMTAHYLTLQEEEVKEIYSDMILSPESKIAGLRAKEIKGKLDDLFHGKTEDEIDDVITDLAKTMSFNPLPTGVCLYDFRRGNCTDGDGCFFYNCPNYITEVQFYPILKDELDLLEKEMARLKELGHEREWQKQYIKYKYLKPLVESLEVQLNGKESVG